MYLFAQPLEILSSPRKKSPHNPNSKLDFRVGFQNLESPKLANWNNSFTSSLLAPIRKQGSISSKIVRVNKIRSFYWKWHLMNGAHIWRISALKFGIILLMKLNSHFLPNYVRQQLFDLGTKFGEIDPWMAFLPGLRNSELISCPSEHSRSVQAHCCNSSSSSFFCHRFHQNWSKKLDHLRQFQLFTTFLKHSSF